MLGHAAPDRLTVLAAAYLTLPALQFLAGWAAPWAALPAIAAGLAALALLPGWRAPWPFGLRTGLLCLALGLLWAGGTGTHHLLYSTADWQLRDAVLRDLSAGPWPIVYADAETGARWLLRAPLGFYLPAGLVGRVAGFTAAQAALWAWTGIGLALVLALLACLARTLAPSRPRRAALLLGALFVGFHGLDAIPNLWLDWDAGNALAAWGRGGEWWARLFQYAGHVTGLLWAPNHALPAWIAALLLLRHWQAPGYARGLALPLAAGAFWSPISALGAALPALLALTPPGAFRRAVLAPGNWLAALLAAPLCLYLLAGAERVPHGPLLLAWPADLALWRWAGFLLVEVLAWAAPAALLVRGRPFVAAVVMLCLLPGYVFGPGNEMTSRGGIAPLAVLVVAVAAALLAPAFSRAARAARAALIGCAAIAAVGAAMEASLLVAKPAWPASAACAVPTAARQSVFQDSTDWSHYLIRWPDPDVAWWLAAGVPDRPVPRDADAPRCWPRGRP